MELIKELYNPDVIMLPIGSYYTMDVKQAAMATKLLKPRFVIPMHYSTFPVIEADPEEFKRLVNEAVDGVDVEIMKPGDTSELNF